MDGSCIKCGGAVSGQFRLVWDKNHHERLCASCARKLEALVAEHGDIGLISLDNPRFVCWLKENRFMSYQEYLGVGATNPDSDQKGGDKDDGVS